MSEFDDVVMGLQEQINKPWCLKHYNEEVALDVAERKSVEGSHPPDAREPEPDDVASGSFNEAKPSGTPLLPICGKVFFTSREKNWEGRRRTAVCTKLPNHKGCHGKKPPAKKSHPSETDLHLKTQNEHDSIEHQSPPEAHKEENYPFYLNRNQMLRKRVE
jgi:hypothetical protein